MKNAKKLSVLIMAAFCAVASLSAENRVAQPGNNQVVVVGKIHVNAKFDRAFYRETRKSLAKGDECDSYQFYCNELAGFGSSVSKKITNFYENNKTFYNDGEYFFVIYDYDALTRKVTGINVVTWLFNSSELTAINLPYIGELTVPSKVQAVYIGDLDYKVSGIDFKIDGVSVSNNQERAQKAMDEYFGKHYDLQYVDITAEK